jgi:hypothetical protein
MGRRVARVRTGVSEERIASIIIVEIIGELGTLGIVVPSSLLLSTHENGVVMYLLNVSSHKNRIL